MKGHIFNLLEDFIISLVGDEKLYEILDKCSFDTSTAFVRTENYPDEQLLEIVNHTVNLLGIDIETAQFEFGKWLYPKLIELVPKELTNFSHPEWVLFHLDDIHKVELTKLYPDATPPTFQYFKRSPVEADLIYHSPRKMFCLVEGVLAGMAAHYQVGITCTVTTPFENNPNQGAFHITYTQAAD